MCDYHGNLVSKAEGKRWMYEYQIEEDGNYMLFFKHADKNACIDAAFLPCACHPAIPTTVGRLINHSAKIPNLRPHKMVIDKKVAIVLVVTRDLQLLEEFKSIEDPKFQKVVPNTAKVIYAWNKKILSFSKKFKVL